MAPPLAHAPHGRPKTRKPHAHPVETDPHPQSAQNDQSQRDCAVQPRVAIPELPWVHPGKFPNPERVVPVIRRRKSPFASNLAAPPKVPGKLRSAS